MSHIKKNALLSVFDKSGIAEFAAFLSASGWNIVSTGGTASYLRENGIAITDVSSLTGFPECLDGRVKTLHPAVHAGILARRSESGHIETLSKLNIGTIDLVCVNLYPFFEKLKEPLSFDEIIEFIDIGGPAMLRSAAKNWRDVIVLCDTTDYADTTRALKQGGVSDEMRRHLAGKVFNLTAAYDAAVSRFLLEDGAPSDKAAAAKVKAASENAAPPAIDRHEESLFPKFWTRSLKKSRPLRYGENAHQKAALYLHEDSSGVLSSIDILGGKELSYNNIRDLDLAWKCVSAFGSPFFGSSPAGGGDVERLLPQIDDRARPCCIAVKHNTPCGAALGADAAEAFLKAYFCDPVSIFGGIAAFNISVTEAAARAMEKIFLEIIIAPDFEEAALKILLKKKNLRLVRALSAPKDRLETVSVDGGLLVQETNSRLLEKWELCGVKELSAKLIPDLLFALRVVSFVKSNAIVIAKNGGAVGIGGGETNRIDAAKSAIQRARNWDGQNGTSVRGEGRLSGAFVLASDAFFPFPDVVKEAARAGIEAIIQSGGSTSDAASIETCEKHKIPMILTGIRYFKH